MKETKSEIRNEYNRYYSNQDFKHFSYADKSFIKSLVSNYNIPVKSKILDTGCGTGKFSMYLSNVGMMVTGVDLSDTAIEISRKRCPKCEFIQGDATKSNLFEKNSFDVIFCAGFSPFNRELSKIDQDIKNIIDYLKPGGLFIFSKTTNLTDKKPIEGKSRTDYTLESYVNFFKKLEYFELLGTFTLQPHLFALFGRLTFNRLFSRICSLITKLTNVSLRAYIICRKLD